MKRDTKKLEYLLGLLLPAILILGWQLYAVSANKPGVAPTIPVIVEVLLHPFRKLLETSHYLYHLLVSTSRVLIGFSLSAMLAIPLGIILGRNRIAYRLINPTINFLRPLSPIVWIPLAMAIFKTYSIAEVFGYKYNAGLWGEMKFSMIFVIVYGGFFPIFSNTLDSVKGVKKLYIESAKLLGTSSFSLYKRVIIPHATPGILTGLKIGLGRTWMVIVAAEMLPGSEIGIGYLISYADQQLEMQIVLAGMVLTGLVGATFNGVLTLISKRFSFWQTKG